MYLRPHWFTCVVRYLMHVCTFPFLYQSEFPASHEQGVFITMMLLLLTQQAYPSLKLFISHSLDEISTIIACAPVIQNLQKPEYPSCRQVTLASTTPHESSHTVPQTWLSQISTRPSDAVVPPTSLMSPSAHTETRTKEIAQEWTGE